MFIDPPKKTNINRIASFFFHRAPIFVEIDVERIHEIKRLFQKRHFWMKQNA